MSDSLIIKILGTTALLAGLWCWSMPAEASCGTGCTAALDELTVSPELNCMGIAFSHTEPDDCGCSIGVEVTNNCETELERAGEITCPYDDCSPMLAGESYYMWFDHGNTSGPHSWSFTVTEADSGTAHSVNVGADVELLTDTGGCSISGGSGIPVGTTVLLGALLMAGVRRRTNTERGAQCSTES